MGFQGDTTVENIENSPQVTVFSEGPTDPSVSTTDYGQSVDFFETSKYPRVGEETCFDVATQDAYGNPTLVDQNVFFAEVLAGVESKPSEDLTTTFAKGNAHARTHQHARTHASW